MRCIPIFVPCMEGRAACSFCPRRRRLLYSLKKSAHQVHNFRTKDAAHPPTSLHKAAHGEGIQEDWDEDVFSRRERPLTLPSLRGRGASEGTHTANAHGRTIRWHHASKD